MMRPLALLALATASPTVAVAQTVPAIQSSAGASADGQGAQASASFTTGSPTMVGGFGQQPKPPPGWPPAPTIVAPSAPLDRKEAASVKMATVWRNKADVPMRDPYGVLRWTYGASQARIVCAPLQICDVELHEGEVVNNVRLGDTAFWSVSEAISGGNDGRYTHVTVTPLDAGRSTSLIIYTDQRTYTLKLVSTQRDYTPRTGFVFPDGPKQESAQDSWSSYRVAVAAGAMRPLGPAAQAGGPMTVDASRIELLDISGDHPSWRPVLAFTDGRKTFIQFPSDMPYGESPALLGVNDDGGLFTAPTERRVIYRVQGNRLVADTVMPRLKLVLGVGSSQHAVTITRRN